MKHYIRKSGVQEGSDEVITEQLKHLKMDGNPGYDCFLLGWLIFRGKLVVSFGEGILYTCYTTFMTL